MRCVPSRVVQGVLLLACSWLACSAASAQPAADAAVEARTEFDAGNVALREGRYEDAVAHLTRSHTLLPNVANGFNLAVALLRAGRPRAALTILRALEDGMHGAPSEAQRAAIAQRITETLARLAQYEIVVERAPDGREGVEHAVIEIDGDEVAGIDIADGAQVSRRVELDPGDHVIVVRSDTYAPRTRQVAASAGSTTLTSFVLTSAPTVAAPAPPPSGIDETALWIGVGVGVAVLAAVAITLGVVLDQPPGPVVDPVTGIGETLTGPAMPTAPVFGAGVGVSF